MAWEDWTYTCYSNITSVTDNTDNGVWFDWNGNLTVKGCNITNTGDSTWVQWTSNTGTDYSYTISDNTWEGWCTIAIPTSEQRVQTEEERLAAQQIFEEQQRKQREEQQRLKEIEDKSLETLLENLEEGEKAMLKKDGTFVIFGEKSKTKYRIRPGTMVEELDEAGEKVIQRLCFHPANPKIPKYDYALSQALMLKWCEEDALRLANRHPADY